MNYIISFFIVLLLVVIFILSFLLFKEKFDTEIPLYTGATESSDKPDDFLTAIGITDPTSQILISNSNGDLSLLSLLTLKKGIDTVSQDAIIKNNKDIIEKTYTTTADLPKTYTTTVDLQKNYLQKRTPYSITNRAAELAFGKQSIHVSNETPYALKADTSTCNDGDWYNFEFDEPCL